MGEVIQRHANVDGFSVVRTYCGHGVHRLFHCPPNVPHYARESFMYIHMLLSVEPLLLTKVYVSVIKVKILENLFCIL